MVMSFCEHESCTSWWLFCFSLSHSLTLTSYPVCPTHKNKDSKMEQRSGNRKRRHFICGDRYMWSPLSSISRLLAWGAKGGNSPETWILFDLFYQTTFTATVHHIFSSSFSNNSDLCIASFSLMWLNQWQTSMRLCLALLPTLGSLLNNFVHFPYHPDNVDRDRTSYMTFFPPRILYETHSLLNNCYSFSCSMLKREWDEENNTVSVLN